MRKVNSLYGAPKVPQKKIKQKCHRHLAVKFGTTPKNLSPPKLQLLVLKEY